MGGVLMNAEVAEELAPGDLGSTFGGGPLACAALIATLDVIRQERLAHRARSVGRELRQRLVGGVVRGVRGEGLLLGLEVGAHAKALKAYLLEKRILVGGSDDPGVLRLMPPLSVGAASVDALVNAVDAFAPGSAAR